MSLPVHSGKTFAALEHILHKTFSRHTEIASLVLVEGSAIQRQYQASLRDPNQTCIISLQPASPSRSLRYEADNLGSEIALLELFHERLAQPKSNNDSPFDLGDIRPRLIGHSFGSTKLLPSYSITTSRKGVPLSTLSHIISESERADIDRQLARLVRSLSNIESPTARFGPLVTVVSTKGPQGSFSTWAEAFCSLFESVLRDGEDVSLNLPYGEIRGHFHRLLWVVDGVKEARLVILNAGNDTNVLVEQAGGKFNLTGLGDWSQGFFGDPLFCRICTELTPAFLEGWNDAGEQLQLGTDYTARRLLYQCWWAIVDIVTEFYRPGQESSTKELVARKRLTTHLSELNRLVVTTSVD
jgi:hypothetical protein